MLKELDQSLLKCLFISAANHLENNKQTVNDLNVFPVPDGDTGTNMSRTLMSAQTVLSANEYTSAGAVASAAASATLRGARGNSGVILSQILRGFASALTDCHTVTANDFIHALSAASKTAYRAVMKPTEGTILTVIRMVSETAETLDDDGDMVSLLEAVVRAGGEALAQTPKMLPVLKKAGVVDAGGQGLQYIFEGMLYAVQNGEPIAICDATVAVAQTREVESAKELRYRYCTEFLVKKQFPGMDGDGLKKEISPRGDSALVIDDDGIIKVHIHTNHPGWVMERAISYGELTDIKVDNLREQNDEWNAARTQEEPEKQAKPKEEQVEEPIGEPADYGIVTVCAGSGLEELFRELGAVVISGGQTMNPSAEELLQAITACNAKQVYILPNNSNIILAAEQAAGMTDKSVRVIKTKTVPQGISALMAFNADSDDAENAASMEEAAALVSTGLLTYAVRDTEMDGVSVQKDDYLAIGNGKIVAAGKDETAILQQLCDALVTDETAVITLIFGEEIAESTATAAAEKLEKAYPEAEVSVLNGGQPVYRYMLGVE